MKIVKLAMVRPTSNSIYSPSKLTPGIHTVPDGEYKPICIGNVEFEGEVAPRTIHSNGRQWALKLEE
jgi:hypothetical protein